MEKAICDAVISPLFYWKRLCPTESFCTVRFVRSKEFCKAVMVIAQSQFFSHAWVEVDGRVVYGSDSLSETIMPCPCLGRNTKMRTSTEMMRLMGSAKGDRIEVMHRGGWLNREICCCGERLLAGDKQKARNRSDL